MSWDQDSRDSVEQLFGNLRRSPFTERIQDPVPQSRPAGDGNIQPVGYIAPGAIDDIVTFADTIRPPEVLDTLPTLPDTDYPDGSFVYLTTDNKLYRNADGTWSVEVDGADIKANSITAGQIAVGAIGADEIAAGAVVSGKVAAGAIQVGHLADMPRNLIPNGGFEADNTTGVMPARWVVVNGSSEGTFQTGGSTTAKSGSYGFVMQRSGAPSTRLEAGPSAPDGTVLAIPVEQGRYTFRAQVRGESDNAGSVSARLSLRWIAADGSSVSEDKQTLSVSAADTWNEIVLVAAAPISAAYVKPNLQLLPDGASSGDLIAWDDVQLVRSDQDVNHAGGNVVIDSTGITITNGKLTFSDSFGNNVLSGAGFGASWFDFIQNRFYNSTFAAPSTASGDLSVSETGGGDTATEYTASLSSKLPYWVVASKSGTGTFQHVADTTASSGKVIRWSNSVTAEIYQDIPVTPGQQYAIILNWKHNASSTNKFNVTIGSKPVDANHTPFGTVTEDALSYDSGSLSNYALEGKHFSSTVPAGARYLRVYIEVAQTAGSPVVSIASVEARPLIEFGAHRITKGSLAFDSTYGVSWSDGTTVDVALVRSGTRTVSLQNPLASQTFLDLSAIRPFLAANTYNGSNTPSDWPQGISVMPVSLDTETGWPTTDGRGVVVTINPDYTPVCIQFWSRHGNTGGTGSTSSKGSLWYRAWQNSTWGDWLNIVHY